jgi:hypothetical protein
LAAPLRIGGAGEGLSKQSCRADAYRGAYQGGDAIFGEQAEEKVVAADMVVAQGLLPETVPRPAWCGVQGATDPLQRQPRRRRS